MRLEDYDQGTFLAQYWAQHDPFRNANSAEKRHKCGRLQTHAENTSKVANLRTKQVLFFRDPFAVWCNFTFFLFPKNCWTMIFKARKANRSRSSVQLQTFALDGHSGRTITWGPDWLHPKSFVRICASLAYRGPMHHSSTTHVCTPQHCCQSCTHRNDHQPLFVM